MNCLMKKISIIDIILDVTAVIIKSWIMGNYYFIKDRTIKKSYLDFDKEPY